MLQRQAERYRDKIAFSFSDTGDGTNSSQLTYRELDSRARSIGAALQDQGAAGERVLVICRSGLEHIAGIFGCLYAGAVAVPLHERLAPRPVSLVPDAQPGFALAAPEMSGKVKTALDALVKLTDGRPLGWCSTDDGDPARWTAPDIDGDTTAFLQYTSGSTSTPRGVVLTHRNLLGNVEAIRRMWDGDDQAVGVTWMPQHNNTGLIGAVIHQVYLGCTSHLMSPTAFLERPIRWLEAISRLRATLTVGPYFGYDLCAKSSTAEERAALDLSSLATAIGGAEPISVADLQGFLDTFVPVGLRPEVFRPSYGLAEATLTVSIAPAAPRPTVAYLDRDALGEDRIVETTADDPAGTALLGSGPPLAGQQVVIVDPDTRHECDDDEVGEIWVAGPNVSPGYWGKPVETEETFGGIVAETGEGPFLRTGDMGFLRGGALFVVGRCTDMVTIGAYHHYPNDIEMTVQGCHRALVPGRGAVFAVTPDSGVGEQLVVAHEVNRDRIGEADLAEIVDAIQTVLATHHHLTVDSVVLVPATALPTTSSNKIQRGRCRDQFLDHSLDTLAEWHAPTPASGARNTDQARLLEIVRAAAARRQRTSPSS